MVLGGNFIATEGQFIFFDLALYLAIILIYRNYFIIIAIIIQYMKIQLYLPKISFIHRHTHDRENLEQ